MGKFVMPTVEEFLAKKRIYSKKMDYVWDYLEKNMLENIDKKPYNNVVHEWLVFLKELKQYQRAEKRKQAKAIEKECGPPWFMQFSGYQMGILGRLKDDIHQDILENIPRRVSLDLKNLGFTHKIPAQVLLHTMVECEEDPGLFMWILYQAIYKTPPSVLRAKYDLNAMIMMSSIVFIDIDECLARLEKLTHFEKEIEVKKEKKEKYFVTPQVKYGEYLQTMKAAYCKPKETTKQPKALPLGNKLRLRSDESYERLIQQDSFLEKRKERNKREKEVERICTYKFWEPPTTLRNNDPSMIAYVEKLKMYKEKAKIKIVSPYSNLQYQVGPVCFVGGKPRFMVNGAVGLATGYIYINGGIALVNGQCPVPIIAGYWRYPIKTEEKCDVSCDCVATWEEATMKYVKETKCTCGHLYDLNNPGKTTEKYFYPPTKHLKYYVDEAKIFQLDPTEDFIKDAFEEGMRSRSLEKISTEQTVSAAGLKEWELAAALLADLADTPLMIPHIPMANHLINIKEWVRKRVNGPETAKTKKRAMLHSQRRWVQLKHFDHRARAYSIPFTQEQLHHLTWAHRKLLQKLFHNLLEDFVTRNRIKQVKQTRMWWSRCKYDRFKFPAFLDVFFTYLPGRMQDVHFINPYCSELTPKYGAKTCPLKF